MAPNLTEKVEQTFAQYIHIENLQESKILLSVSGGVDSCVLLDVAAKICEVENLAVFHFHHGTNQAEETYNFVQNLCSEKKVKFYGYQISDEEKTHKNLENHWRQLRQKYSQRAHEDFGAAKILTAHHATDLVETMIFRLVKGCGVTGLAPFDTSTKPFWQLAKTTLLDYAKEQKLKWIEDLSNKNTVHQRNLIRQEVIPALREITPNLEKVFAREHEIFAQTNEWLQESLHAKLGNFVAEKSLPLSKWETLSEVLQIEFLRSISAKTPSQSEIEDALKWLNHDPKGNSEKMVGGTNLVVKAKSIEW